MSIYCTNCGKPNSEDDNFCIWCGVRLEKGDVPPIPEPPVVTPPELTKTTPPGNAGGFDQAGDL